MYVATAPNKRIIVSVAAIWASERFFPEANYAIFPGVAKKTFPEGTKSGEISFCPLETKKLTLLIKL